ncbi:gliding motility-associated C-terminal domain-containing protein, partial [Maribacter confluentis]|nr:gliding motility-associated C-terminal domain-containing protein [Maribacter confluentis]
NDLSKVEGYAAITNKQEFIFPIGDRTFLRPLIIRSTSINLLQNAHIFMRMPTIQTHSPAHIIR